MKTNPCSRRIRTCSFRFFTTAKWSRFPSILYPPRDDTLPLVSIWSTCSMVFALEVSIQRIGLRLGWLILHEITSEAGSDWSCFLKASRERSLSIMSVNNLIVMLGGFIAYLLKRLNNSTEFLFAAICIGVSPLYDVLYV